MLIMRCIGNLHGSRFPRMAYRMLCNGTKALGEQFDIHTGGIDLFLYITQTREHKILAHLDSQ
jgi:hypothetical protein